MKKYLLLVTYSLALALPLPNAAWSADKPTSAQAENAVAAATSRPAPGTPASGDRFIGVFLSRNDQNGDGKVGKSEFRGSPARFDEMDANGNGQLEQEELLPLFRSRLNDSKSMRERLQEQTATGGQGSADRPATDNSKPGARAFARAPDGRQVSGEFIFKRLDLDGDGKLTVLEFSKSPGMNDPVKARETVARIDQDKDECLSWEEFDRVFQMRHGSSRTGSTGFRHPYLIAMGAKGRAGCSPEQLAGYERVFGRLDADGDGHLTTKEYVEDGRYLNQQARAGIFRASDSNGDGTVTRAEYIENRIITDEGKAIMDRADFDGDRTITRAEFLKHPALTKETMAAEIFGQLDSNGDGETATPEYLRVWGKWARKSGPRFRQQGPGPGGPPGGSRDFRGPPSGGFQGGGPPDPARLFQRFDRNEDGKLGKEEVPEFLWSRLSSADADKDGAVTQSELKTRNRTRRPASGETDAPDQ